ncbi:tryptophan 7-halogenase [Pseudoduganella sp. LjRoot289]|uniref:tryptophan halogenase family protein n=1 Tax=Pseudoduganella sp. LjRoot289 TaxID=3342314 RepID=UPI003ED0B627
MNDNAIRKIVIVGGGTAGWMAAAPLIQRLGRDAREPCEIVLLESAEIGTIGVGEGTMPNIHSYTMALGLDHTEFLRRTKATFKLGIEFKDWGHIGNRFFHGFGEFGPSMADAPALHHWLRLHRAGGMGSHEQWSLVTEMARRNRFTPPGGLPPPYTNSYAFAYHFDAALFASFLRDYSVQRGVQRIEGTIVDVTLRAQDGFVESVTLSDGRRIGGDLFIDCSGQRALLIEGAMESGFDDWSRWLPVNRAIAMPSASAPSLAPYTLSTAHAAGWTWRIPLQHRIGNGHVYCSDFTTDTEAEQVLLRTVDTAPLDAPRGLRFTTGRRRRMWVKNVVAIGLSAGFLEPLESTAIQLILSAVGRLIKLFPDRDCSAHLAGEFNRLMAQQYESIRDFIILHYKINRRTDSEFWRWCRDAEIPDALQHQIELFRSSGLIAQTDPGGFTELSYLSVLLGLGVLPERHNPMVDLLDEQAVRLHFERLRTGIQAAAHAMPDHAAYIERLLAAR